jgi:hypothetical protein
MIFFRKFYTETVAYRSYGDEDRNTNIYTTELSMIESNGSACCEVKWGFGRTNEHRREGAQSSNKSMLSWYVTQ